MWVLVVASLLVTVGLKSNLLHYDNLALATGLEDPWRAVTTLFAYQSTGYEAVTVGTIEPWGLTNMSPAMLIGSPSANVVNQSV